MRAIRVFERLEFERGQDPAEAMRLGKYRLSELRRYLVKYGSVDFPEAFEEWINDNPLLKEKLEYDKNKSAIYYCIELDSFTEDMNIDREELEMEFNAQYSFNHIKPGEVRVKIGTIGDGSKVIYYSGGNIDGFVTRKDWLR
jgi:hypothetical protein